MKTLLIFLFDFLEGQNVVHNFLSENSQISQETVKYCAAKTTKIIKILDLFRNADVSRSFC